MLAARAAAARASGPSRRCRSRGRGSPSGRPPGAVGRDARRGRGRGPRRRRARAGRAIPRLTRTTSTVIATPRPGRRRSTDAVVDHPGSDSRRSRAAWRSRALQLGVAEPGPQRGGERRRVVGRDQQPRPDPVGAVTEGLGHPADVGGEDRQAAGQGLGDDHAVGLGARRQHQQVRGGVAAVEIGSGPRSREVHAVARARRPARGGADASTNAGSRSRLPTHTQCQDRSGDRRQRIEQHVVALVEGHRRDAEQRPAGRGPGRELGGVDAGLGDVHPVGGQRVELQQPAAGSTRWS